MHQINRNNHSWVTFITGSMRSGKSAALIEILDEINSSRTLILKPSKEVRDGSTVKTRKPGYNSYNAISVDESNEQIGILLGYAVPYYKHIIIDEVQFMSPEFVELLMEDCYHNGVELIVAGLLKDFKGNYFPASKLLFDNAEVVKVYSSECYKCGDKDGSIDVLMNGDDEVILEGESVQVEGQTDHNHYETLCTLCFLNR
jgi:thymidine kinase